MFESNSWVEADYRQALEHLRAGRIKDAEQLLRAVLAMEPNHSPAWFSLGQTLLQTRNYREAGDAFATVTALQPDMSAAYVSWAAALLGEGRAEEALQVVDRAEQLLPGEIAYQALRTQALIETGRFEEAEAAAERGREAAPDSPRFPYLLGYLHRKTKQLDKAAAGFLAAVEKAPAFADAWADLGTVRQAQRQWDEAEAAYRRALELAPAHMLALLNLAQMLLNANRISDARPVIDALIESGSSSPDTWRLAAEQARLEGRNADAVAHYEKLLGLRPGQPEALTGLGLALQACSRFQEALNAFQRATEVAPNAAGPWAYLAALLLMTGHVDQSITCYRNAVTLEPNEPNWQEALGWLELDIGEPASALSRFECAAALVPDDAVRESSVIYCQSFQPQPSLKALASRMRSWGKKHAKTRTLPKPARSGAADGPLRVAYLLPNMANHPMRPFVEALLGAHSRERVELIAYTATPEQGALPPSLAASVERWRFLLGATTEQIAEQMQRDGVDILVDVSGHRPGHRLDVLALGAAPVQLTWPIGTGLGAGLPILDGIIADPLLMPAATAKLFGETVIHPGPAYVCYRPPQGAPLPQAMAPTGPITFGYLGRMARLNARVVAVWSAILKQVPGSRLLLDHGGLHSDLAQARIRERFSAQGISPERILAGYSSPVWTAWEQIDITLDPFPSSAGATVLEGLSLGRPAVTLASEIPSGRFGAAILPHVGLGDWVTSTEADYVARAVAAAGDRALLAELRTSLRDRLLQSPLCDAVGFARGLEAEYRRLYEAKRGGKS